MEATARDFKDIDLRKAQSMQEIGQRLRRIVQSGTKISAIAEEAGTNRAYVSGLTNNGTAGIGDEALKRLWGWVSAWERSQGINEPSEFAPEADEGERADMVKRVEDTAPTGGCGTDVNAAGQGAPGMTKDGLIRTADLVGAVGFCDFCVKHREIGVVSGMPGTGKTTVAEIIEKKYPHVIRIEAWLSMRMSDLYREIGQGLGVTLKGSLQERNNTLLAALRQHPETILLIDEAEYLKKWDVEKLDTLRKMQDKAHFTLFYFGTPIIKNIIARADTTQLSRRMFQYDFGGARREEIRKALAGCDMDAAVVEKLASIAANTARGGMGSYSKVLELCKYSAQGGRITEDILREAMMYKPGL